jgi:methionine-rich copper-binding protein CopC
MNKLKILYILGGTSLFLLIILGQNCSRSKFLAYDSSSLSSEAPGPSSSLIVSTSRVNRNKSESLKQIVDEVEKSGGKITHVLPTGDFEVEYASIDDAQSVLEHYNQKAQAKSLGQAVSGEVLNVSVKNISPPPKSTTPFDRKNIKLLKTPKGPLQRVPVTESSLNEIGQLRQSLLQLSQTYQNNLGTSNTGLLNKVDNSVALQFPQIGAQGNIGSCVAWSTGYYMNSYENALTARADIHNTPNSPYICSPSYLYPLISGGGDNGSLPILSFVTLQHLGCASMNDSPYNLIELDPITRAYNKQYFPSTALQISALTNKIEGFRTIANAPLDDTGIQALKTELQNGRIISTGISIYDSFYNYESGVYSENLSYAVDEYGQFYTDTQGKIIPTYPIYPVGGHAVTIVGYDDSMTYNLNGIVYKGAFKIANSWGTSWGDNGFIWISYELFKQPEFSTYSFNIIKDFEVEPTLKAYLVVHSKINDSDKNMEYNITVGTNQIDIVGARAREFGVVGNDGYLTSFLITHDLSNYIDTNQNMTIKVATENENTTILNAELYINSGTLLFNKISHQVDPTSNSVTLSFNNEVSTSQISIPIIITQPSESSELELSLNRTLNLGVGVNGIGLTYQWLKDGVEIQDDTNISGTNTAFLSIKNIQTDHAGIYTVRITNLAGSVMSQAALIRVYDMEPDPFAWNSGYQMNMNLGQIVQFREFTVTGINTATNISIDNSSLYSINGGAFTKDPGKVISGDRITVQHTAAISFDSIVLSALNIGGVTKEFISKTMLNDILGPQLVSKFPADDGLNIALDTNFYLFFNQPVILNTGSIIIYNATDNSTVISIDIKDANQVSISGKEVIIDPSVDLKPSTPYYIGITQGIVKNANNKVYDGNIESTAYNFTTTSLDSSTLPLYLSKKVPNTNAYNVAVNSNIVLTFNKSITIGTGNITINLSSNNTSSANPGSATSKSINITDSSQVSINGNILTINPTTDFAFGTYYYINIAPGVIKDLAGTDFAGITNSSDYTFTTIANYSIPRLIGISPLDDSMNTNTCESIYFIFNKPIKAGSGYIHFYRTPDNALVRSISTSSLNLVRIEGNQVKINIDPCLNFSTSYYINIDPDAIISTDGYSYPGISNNSDYNFTTQADRQVPVLSGENSLTPARYATSIPVETNIVLNFNEKIKAGFGYIQIYADTNTNTNTNDSRYISVSDTSQVTITGNVLTINPSTNFQWGTTYHVVIDAAAISDMADNFYSGISSGMDYQFSTMPNPILTTDTTAPVLVSRYGLLPPPGSLNVDIKTTIYLSFNEPITQGTGSILIYRMTDNSLARSININDSTQVSLGTTKTTVILNPASDLENNTRYYIKVASGVIKDLAGNNFAGINNTDFNFTTIAGPDTVAPVLAAITPKSPSDNAINVAVNTSITLRFNENIKAGTGNIMIYRSADNTITRTISVTDSTQVTFAGSTIIVKPTLAFGYNRSFYVKIASGVIKDIAGNNYVGISNSTDYNFTTIRNP